MKERPILFSAPMVQAILAGNKTQTRRVAKHPLLETLSYIVNIGDGWFGDEEGDVQVRCPYGKVGDQLWVRETWQGPLLDEDQREQFRHDGSDAFKKPEFCAYRATDTLDAIDDDGNELGWRPSIHMPRWASRIQLEITNVRVERLKDITAEDALAEGVAHCAHLSDHWNEYAPDEQFSMLWSAINGMESWHANPWVWVIEFKRIERNPS